MQLSRRPSLHKLGDMAESVITVRALIRTCSSCPSQWEGQTRDGRFVYVRYRWGTLSIGIGASREESINHSGNLLDKELGDHLDGVLEFEQLRAATADLIEWPDTDESVNSRV